MKIDLSGKTAIVTGATGELGRTMTRTLAKCGANIVIHYNKNIENAEKLYGEIISMGRKAIIIQADVTDFSSVIKMRDFVIARLNAPDIVVTNAVIQYKWTTILEQDLNDYESQVKSSIMHNVHMAKAFVPFMIKKRYGRFIGINTESAMQCAPTQSAYAAGKRGMDGILRVLAREVGEYQITVNQVAPGWTVSDRDRLAGTDKGTDYEKIVPMRRRGTDQEVANVVAFLASDLASFITGAYIPVNGGDVMPAI